MNRIAFYGSIWSGDYQLVANVLREWLKTDELDIKIRLGGEEIVYEDDKIYLYCYNAVADAEEKPSFLLEGNISATLDETKLLLQQLLQLYKSQNIVANFEYVEVNADGDEVSDQFYIK